MGDIDIFEKDMKYSDNPRNENCLWKKKWDCRNYKIKCFECSKIYD